MAFFYIDQIVSKAVYEDYKKMDDNPPLFSSVVYSLAEKYDIPLRVVIRSIDEQRAREKGSQYLFFGSERNAGRIKHIKDQIERLQAELEYLEESSHGQTKACLAKDTTGDS